MERQSLCLLLSSTLSELEVFRKVLPVIEVVLAGEAAKVAQEHTIEHERTTTSAVKQLRNDLKDEKIDAEDKVCTVTPTPTYTHTRTHMRR